MPINVRNRAGVPPDAVADRVEAAVLAASEGRLRDVMAGSGQADIDVAAVHERYLAQFRRVAAR